MRDVTAFSVSDILGLTFSLYIKDISHFIPLFLIAFTPSLAFLFLGGNSATDLPDPENFDFWQFVTPDFFVGILFGIWLQVCLAYGVVQYLRGGGSPGFFVQSLRRLPAAILVWVVVSVATIAGFLLFVVPGIIICLAFWVALPAVVVERGGLRALRRSAQLTAGYKGQIFGLMLILSVPEYVLVPVVVVGVMNSLAADGNSVATDGGLALIVPQLLLMVWGGIRATAVAITYHDLRVLKDGVDTREISRVFE